MFYSKIALGIVTGWLAGKQNLRQRSISRRFTRESSRAQHPQKGRERSRTGQREHVRCSGASMESSAKCTGDSEGWGTLHNCA